MLTLAPATNSCQAEPDLNSSVINPCTELETRGRVSVELADPLGPRMRMRFGSMVHRPLSGQNFQIFGKNLKKIIGKEFCEVMRAGAHFANRDHCQHAMCNCNICCAVGARDGADMSGRNGRHYKEGRTSMCTLESNTEMRMLAGGIVGLLCAGAAVWPALAAEGTGTAASMPIFAPDGATAWVPDRPFMPRAAQLLPIARGVACAASRSGPTHSE
jgi:hypothetical protein